MPKTINTLDKQETKQKNVFEITKENSYFIAPSQWGITNGFSIYPILKTWGIETCVGVSIYNEDTKEAVLIHILKEVGDWLVTEKLIDVIIKILIRKDKSTKLITNLVFCENDLSILVEVEKILSIKDNLLIKNKLQGTMLAIDAASGEISTDFQESELNYSHFSSNYFSNLLPVFNGTFNKDIIKIIKKLEKEEWKDNASDALKQKKEENTEKLEQLELKKEEASTSSNLR